MGRTTSVNSGIFHRGHFTIHSTALGVGLKTFDSGAVPVLGTEPPEASDFGRLHQLWRVVKSRDDTPNGNLPSPGLGSMMSASYTSAGTVRSTSALQGLMDQGAESYQINVNSILIFLTFRRAGRNIFGQCTFGAHSNHWRLLHRHSI